MRMMHGVYLATLLVSLGCIGLVDRRWGLVLWSDARRGATVLAAGVVAFLAWDFAAVHEGFYRRGGSEVMTGLQIAPDVPLEEVFFVLFLCYVTIVLHRLVARLLGARRGREEPAR
jgi:lycopene cyclase domain-containing protein